MFMEGDRLELKVLESDPINRRIVLSVTAAPGIEERAARAAADAGDWAAMAPRDRGQALIRLARLIEDNGEELQLLETLDVGKPIRYSRRVDVQQAITTYEWYGEAADKLYDDIAPTGPDALGLITREPVGVVEVVWAGDRAASCSACSQC